VSRGEAMLVYRSVYRGASGDLGDEDCLPTEQLTRAFVRCKRRERTKTLSDEIRL